MKSLGSQFPFLHTPNDPVPLIEAFLYGNINWILAQDQHQSPSGLSKASAPVMGCKARSKLPV